MQSNRDTRPKQEQAVKILKYIGKILSAFALLFVIRKLYGMNVPWEELASPQSVLLLVLFILYQTAKMFTCCTPWRCFVRIFSRRSVPYRETVIVYLKSNVLKYLPGNVFQYIGRNELAVQSGIPHMRIALATLFDIGANFAMALFYAILTMGGTAIEYLKDRGAVLVYVLIAGMIFLAVIWIVLLKTGWLKRIMDAIKAMTLSDWGLFLKSLLYYLLLNMAGGLQFILICVVMLGVRIEPHTYWFLTGANALSFVLGYITPGAPGGIGVRESVMIILTAGYMPESMIALAMVITRLVGVTGDVVAYLLAKWIERKGKGTENERMV